MLDVAQVGSSSSNQRFSAALTASRKHVAPAFTVSQAPLLKANGPYVNRSRRRMYFTRLLRMHSAAKLHQGAVKLIVSNSFMATSCPKTNLQAWTRHFSWREISTRHKKKNNFEPGSVEMSRLRFHVSVEALQNQENALIRLKKITRPA